MVSCTVLQAKQEAAHCQQYGLWHRPWHFLFGIFCLPPSTSINLRSSCHQDCIISTSPIHSLCHMLPNGTYFRHMSNTVIYSLNVSGKQYHKCLCYESTLVPLPQQQAWTRCGTEAGVSEVRKLYMGGQLSHRNWNTYVLLTCLCFQFPFQVVLVMVILNHS